MFLWFLLRPLCARRVHGFTHLLASVLHAAKPLIYFGSEHLPSPTIAYPRREILIKVALRVARSQIKALFRPFYESCISEPPNQFLWLINHATHESATHCSRRGERRRRQPARVRVAAPRGPRRRSRRRLPRRSRVVRWRCPESRPRRVDGRRTHPPRRHHKNRGPEYDCAWVAKKTDTRC